MAAGETPELHPQEGEFVHASVRRGTRLQKTRYVMSWFESWIRFRASIGRLGVVVFDIDDTLIDSQERRIAPVARLYQLCQTLGFECAIVTARPEGPVNRSETIKALHAAGVDDWLRLYMMPNSMRNQMDTDDDVRRLVSAYKRSARDDIVAERNVDIVGNVGDMWHDLIRFPLSSTYHCLKECECGDCAILFPKHAHGEVAIKLVGASL